MEETNKVGVINLKDFIGDCNDFVGMFLIDIIKQVKAQPEANCFKFFINSDGGELLEAWKIYDYIQLLKKEGIKVMTIGEEKVRSAATVVLLSADKGMRFIKSDADFMIHTPSGGVSGNTKEISDYNEMIGKINQELCSFYSKEFEIPNDSILSLMESEIFFSAQDCQDLGIAQIYNETPIVARAKK